MEDAELLRRAASDPACFGELVSRHQAFVFGAAFRVTKDRSLAEDIAQDAFLKAFRVADSYRGEGPVRGWLYRIAQNLALNAVTRSRETPSDDIDEMAFHRTPEWEVLRDAEIGRVRAAIEALPLPLRSPLVLREYHDDTYEEIAEKLDIPINTVRTRIHRARKALEESLKERS